MLESEISERTKRPERPGADLSGRRGALKRGGSRNTGLPEETGSKSEGGTDREEEEEEGKERRAEGRSAGGREEED